MIISMKGITLIGMAGAGKSTVGQILATMLGWRFVDLDKLILQTQGTDHHSYMKQNGEEALKQLEEHLTMDLDFNRTVFAPPGSVIYSSKSMEKIGQESTAIYLMATPVVIEARLGDRLYENGIIGLEEKGLTAVMAERIPLYEKYAQYRIETSDQSKEAIAKKIIMELKLAGEKNAV